MICKNCGKEFEVGTKFCPECGTKVDEENNSVEIKNEITVEEKENSSQAQNVISANDNSEKKSFIKDIMANEKKKIIFIAGVIAIIVIFIVIIIAASKSGSNNNYYGNGNSYDSNYSDYDDDFGNNEIVTQPQTTEMLKLDYDVEVDEKLYDSFDVIATVLDYKFVPQNSVYGVCWGVEIIFNFEILDNSENRKYFNYDFEYYDKNGNLIGTDDCIASIADGKARGTTLISFDMLNGELSKIVVLGGD